jgi:hypothetical protein
MSTRTAAATLTVAILAGVSAAVPVGPAHAATWSMVPTPNATAGRNQFRAVAAPDPAGAWAVGYAQHNTAPAERPLAARWNGGMWALVPTPAPSDGGRLAGIDAAAGGEVWAVGSSGVAAREVPLIQRWTGTEWSVVPSPSPAGAASALLHGVATFGAAGAWAVGHAVRPGATPSIQTLVQRWDGAAWSVVPSPNPNSGQNLLFAVDGAAVNDVWAVGGMGFNGYNEEPVAGMLMHWDGSSWTHVAIPAHPSVAVSALRGVVALAADNVWAVGDGFSRALFRQVPCVLHWDGRSWRHVVIPDAPNGTFTGVSALAPDRIYAVGDAAGATLVMRWNGSAWVREATPAPGRYSGLSGVSAAAPGTVWAVGLYSDGSEHRTLAVRTTTG